MSLQQLYRPSLAHVLDARRDAVPLFAEALEHGARHATD
jgi:hypothetical protein